MNKPSETIEQATEKEFFSKTDFVQHYPHLFTMGELEYLVKHRHYNGFSVAVRKIGQRKILISVPDVLSWIDDQKG